MKYGKPELVLNASATRAVQGSMNKPPWIYLDANGRDYDADAAAYEADE